VCVVEGVQGLVYESCVRLDDASIVSKMASSFPFVVYSLAAFAYTIDAAKPYHSFDSSR